MTPEQRAQVEQLVADIGKPDPRKTIAVLLFDDVEELDAVGPYEVLASWTLVHPEDGWRVVTTVPVDSSPDVDGAKDLRMSAAEMPERLGQLDVLVHPGGRGTRRLLADEEHLDWVRGQAEGGALMTSVCTGALVFAASGLLAGRPATTHWRALGELAALDPTIELRPDDRYVDDGQVITSAGVSAGIDMALHLVARLAGRHRAMEVRRAIQYDPAPPV